MKSFAVSAGVSLLLGLGVLASPDAVRAAVYFGCNTGYEFKTNTGNSGAHCLKPQSYDVKPISCPSITVPVTNQTIGTFPQARSGKDKCVGQTKVAGVASKTEHEPLACPPGYSYVQNLTGNTDKCRKTIAAQIAAPTRKFASSP